MSNTILGLRKTLTVSSPQKRRRRVTRQHSGHSHPEHRRTIGAPAATLGQPRDRITITSIRDRVGFWNLDSVRRVGVGVFQAFHFSSLSTSVQPWTSLHSHSFTCFPKVEDMVMSSFYSYFSLLNYMHIHNICVKANCFIHFFFSTSSIEVQLLPSSSCQILEVQSSNKPTSQV